MNVDERNRRRDEMEHQCDVEITKLANGFLVTRTKGPTPFIEDGYCFQHFSGLRAWLYQHFRDEEDPKADRSTPYCGKALSERMRIREQQADITNGEDSPFITMDRRVWLDYADEVEQLEGRPIQCTHREEKW